MPRSTAGTVDLTTSLRGGGGGTNIFQFRPGDGGGEAGRKLLCGGGWHGSPFARPPPPPWSPCREGGLGRGCPTCRAVGGRGGLTPTYMAQNDPHVALNILTAHMWGGGIFREKNFSGPNFVFRRLRHQHPPLHKTKGPARKPISGTPLPLLRRAPMPSPPHPPQSRFRVTRPRRRLQRAVRQ